MYICAICKGYVYRVDKTRVSCEKPGCLDLDLHQDDFKLEYLMNLIMKVLLEHKQGLEEAGRPVCRLEETIKVRVQKLSECGLCDDEM